MAAFLFRELDDEELDDEELNDYMIEYHPYYNGRNPKHTHGSDSQTLVYLKSGQLQGRDPGRFYAFCERVKKWLLTSIRSVIEEAQTPSLIVVSVAPGHKEKSPPNFLHDIVRDVLKQPEFRRVKNGSHCLQRTKTVPKSTDGSTTRSVFTHLDSIQVDDSEIIKGKIVMIVDDVWTTGSTLRACASLVKNAGASDTKLIAVGKTVSVPDPEEF